MARRSSSSGIRYAAAAEASREARENRLRRAGWEPGTPYPGVDDQGGGGSHLSSEFSPEYSSEFT